MPLAPLAPASVPLLTAPRVSLIPVAPIGAPTARPLAAKIVAARALTQSLPKIPIAAAPQAAAQSFALLSGETVAELSESPVAIQPSDPRQLDPLPPPDKVKNVRRMMAATAAMKAGMDVVTLSVPLLALQTLGGATIVATLLAAYGISQAVFAGLSGSLTDRFMAHKVLAWAVASQALFVSSIVLLGALNTLSASTLLPLYILLGGAVGIAETTRHSIPALILGHDSEALSRYNASLHFTYEIAGVTGALVAGALIGFFGPLWALMLQPPAYIIASSIFMSVRHRKPSARTALTFVRTGLFGTITDQIKSYFKDVKAGANLVLGDGRLRWIALAFILPQIIHRVLEGMIVPILAKTVLDKPHYSAWMLTASNAGELSGAGLLWWFNSRFPWVKWGAAGILSLWTLAFSTALPLLIAAIFIAGTTWAASDLRLRSEVQSLVPQKDQPRAFSFLYSVFVLGTAAVSFALGSFIDWLGMSQALYWICGGITVLAASVFVASRKIASAGPPSNPSAEK